MPILAPIITTFLVHSHIEAIEEVRSRTGRNDIPLFNPYAKARAEREEHETRERTARDFKASVEKQISDLDGLEYVTFDEYVAATSHVRSMASNDRSLSERFRIIDQRMEIKFLVKKHFFVLQRKMNTAVVKNDYGMVVKDNTNAVWQEFLTSAGFEFDLVSDEGRDLFWHMALAYHTIDGHVTDQEFDPQSIPSNGFEFERWVAENLRKFGWDTSVTAASGDQGVDVIAEKSGIKVGIQCKLYNGSVGNKAVQEVIAAQKFHKFHRAAVISNASYTKSAKELSLSSKVQLLNHHDIPNFDRLFL